MPWGKKSGRTTPLPPGWNRLKLQIKRRDRFQCQWVLESGNRAGEKCLARATDVDHMGKPWDHRPEMLQALCGYHHDQKTASQGGDAAQKYKRERERKDKRKQHPGYM